MNEPLWGLGDVAMVRFDQSLSGPVVGMKSVGRVYHYAINTRAGDIWVREQSLTVPSEPS